MKYVIARKTSLAHYTADVCIVRCFDDRFRAAFEKFLKAKKIRHADFECVAGGAKVFASPEKKTDREFLLRELEKSIRLHRTKKVILFTHQDCGAYGGSARFGKDREEEVAFHRREQARARAAIRRRFPAIRIESYFMDSKGVINLSETV